MPVTAAGIVLVCIVAFIGSCQVTSHADIPRKSVVSQSISCKSPRPESISISDLPKNPNRFGVISERRNFLSSKRRGENQIFCTDYVCAKGELSGGWVGRRRHRNGCGERIFSDFDCPPIDHPICRCLASIPDAHSRNRSHIRPSKRAWRWFFAFGSGFRRFRDIDNISCVDEDISPKLLSTITYHHNYRGDQSDDLKDTRDAGDGRHLLIQSQRAEPTKNDGRAFWDRFVWLFIGPAIGLILCIWGYCVFDGPSRILGGVIFLVGAICCVSGYGLWWASFFSWSWSWLI